jgi:hypothetical protein
MQELENTSGKSKELSARIEFILDIGNEPCGFPQKSHVSGLPYLHSKPYTLSFSPCLPNQFVPFCA